MNETRLLTVIVPCYNVERYVERCVGTIVGQTYGRLEIVLVDDGSTDGTGALLDTLATGDRRIRVIHQKNQGPSVTREVGLKAASGEYVTFVDADDWIHERMYETMVGRLEKENADIAICGVCDAYDGSAPPHHIVLKHRRLDAISDAFSAYRRVDAMCKLVEDKEWKSYFWNKIYRRTMFNDVKFPIGRGLDEDFSIMHQVFHNAEKVIYNKSEFYYYYRYQGSLSSNVISDEDSAKKAFDRNSAIWERYVFIMEHPEYHAVLNFMANYFVSESLAVLRYAYKHMYLFPKNYAEMVRRQMLDIYLPLSKQMPEFFNNVKRMEFLIFKHCLPLYKFLARRYKKRYWQFK